MTAEYEHQQVPGKTTNRKQVEQVYNYIDELWRLTFGDTADFSSAFYNGSFSKSLEQAQRDKHEYILSSINFQPGHRVLDIGCGWGGMMSAVERGGGRAVGITLSTRQAKACQRAGLAVHVLDWRDLRPDLSGRFDGIVSLGAFEHFCSATEYLDGSQDAVYQSFFRLCDDLLREDGRLYLQTQLWGKNAPDYASVSLKAPVGSDAYILATIETMFRNSCLPFSKEQIELTARPYFRLVSHLNGRLDCIHTIEEWRKRLRDITFRKLWVYIKMARRAFVDQHFLHNGEILLRPYYAECFKRNLMDHERMVFQKEETFATSFKR